MDITKMPENLKQRRQSILSISLFSAWMLSFPFEGQILYSLAAYAQIDPTTLVISGVFFEFAGLFVTGFFIRIQAAAKVCMIGSMVVCLAGSLIFFLPFSVMWYIAIIAIAFFAGLFVASWAFYYKACSKPHDRLKTAADILIITNLLMILINVLTVTVSVVFGLSIATLSVLTALPFVLRLEASPDRQYIHKMKRGLTQGEVTYLKPFVFLCVFVVIITINSGLMYQVFNPAFAHYELLASYYWAIPYIVALLILRNLPVKTNQAYILYIAMTMIGFAYILFIWLDRSVASYFIIDTLMLGSFGVCDLFWWSIFGSFFEYADNPAKILGIGLSMNVLGIFCGDLIGSRIVTAGGDYLSVMLIAVAIILTVIILLPVLNAQLTRLFKEHTFLIKFADMEEREQDMALTNIKEYMHLTEKEAEVVKLLLRGYTYKAIAENLFISENTLKYHIKNIYQKLNINNKMELIKLFADKKK